MSSKEMLHMLILQLRNNFALSKEEESVLSVLQLHGGGYKYAFKCFTEIKSKYFKEENGLSPFNSVQYTNYLYWTSHLLYKDGHSRIADKVYYLNKMLNGVDLFYAIELPEHWNCEHPLGSVMGRAKYGDYFFFYQGCTVGGNHHLEYPVLGHHVTMYSNSKILGRSHVGSNVIIAANAYVKDTDIPDDTIVFGQFPNLVLKKKKISGYLWRDKLMEKIIFK